MEGFFMTEKYGFVYIWRDKKNNRYYVGCHWGTIDDGYICSSNWMRDAYRRRPSDFRRRIIIANLTRKEMYLEEQRMFSMIKPEELKTRYYNLRLNTTLEPWHADPDKLLTVGQKISKANTGKKRPCTPERARKISEGKKGKRPNWSEEGLAKKKASLEKPLSEEHKAAISERLAKFYETNESRSKGRTQSEETKAAISAKLMGIDRGEYVMTAAREEAIKTRQNAAVEALSGSKAYNNGEIEIRSKVHPGEGWVLGGLKRQKLQKV